MNSNEICFKHVFFFYDFMHVSHTHTQLHTHKHKPLGIYTTHTHTNRFWTHYRNERVVKTKLQAKKKLKIHKSQIIVILKSFWLRNFQFFTSHKKKDRKKEKSMNRFISVLITNLFALKWVCRVFNDLSFVSLVFSFSR